MRIVDRVSLVLDGSFVLGDVLARFGALHPDRRLYADDRDVCTFREASERVDRMAAGIGARVQPGERVVVATPNGYDQLLACIAASRAGAIAVPVNAQMRAEEIDGVVTDSGAALIVRDAAEVLAPAAISDDLVAARRPAPTAVAAIFYTSGTTGKPKGAELSHRALAGSLRPLALMPDLGRRDEIVAALPVAHIMGFAVLLSAAAAGIPVYALAKFRATEILDAIEVRRPTMFVGVPAMYRLMLEAGAEQRDLSSIRVWASGADVMPADLARRFQRMGAAVTLPLLQRPIGAAAFVEGYGMVETGGAVAAKVAPPGLAVSVPVIGDVLGIPLPGNHLRVVDEDGAEVAVGQTGELLVRGPSVLSGYHGDAAATARVLDPAGWLHTGDLARRGAFGLVTFAGRAKDVIKSGGYSIYAVEIERAMEAHPDVVEAAAVGIPDDRLGERTGVAVRLRVGASTSEDELLEWGATHLSDYKRPRAVRVVDEMPRTGTDKVAKRHLLPLFAA